MNEIVDVVRNRKCTGCGACINICPKGAIKMQRDKEGFLVPVVDKSKCVKCDLCNKVCPLINEVSRSTQFSTPKVYAGWNKDEAVRMQSSSGGVFSLLSHYVLKKKGYVCGAGFDKNNKLGHIIISKQKDLVKLRGSKYIQSEIGSVYKDIKKLLERKRWVLFSGTPCQVIGLRSFLRMDYKKLIVVDLICHGTPSPLVFEKYIKDVEKRSKSKIDRIEFRNKSTGWRSFSFILSGKNRILHKDNSDHDLFFKGFIGNLYLNPICTNCPFAMFPRYSDITLGDYWGIWDYKKELDDDKGTSLITVNNDKGGFIFDCIKSNLFFEEIPKETAAEKLKTVSLPCVRHFNRDNFLLTFVVGKPRLAV